MRPRLKSTEFFGAMLFVFAVIFPPFDDLAEVDLSVHMSQHVIVIIAGALIAYPLYKRGFLRPTRNWMPKIALLAASGAIVFWHLPGSWDAAVLNPLVHAAEHFTFLLVGLVIGSLMQALSDSLKISALLAVFFGHMGYAAILVAPWGIQVYPLYSVSNQAVLGWSLILTGWAFLVGVAYIIKRNPAWLQGFSGEAKRQPREGPGPSRRKWRATALPVASFSLILILAVYFAATGVALASAIGTQQGGAVVYIVETPVSWQYTPQNVVVVIGTNNSLTWVSRSTSYDTITSDAGLFNSGPIQPGGTFRHVFDVPGAYMYHCAFHPWMSGRVTVLPKQ